MAGIYLHIPFCVNKCNYCDFYSLALFPRREREADIDVSGSPEIFKKFPDYLCKEIDVFSREYDTGDKIDSIFFGGGTPSLLGPQKVEQILNKLREKFNIAADAEITFESNPGTLNQEKLSDYKSLGINRLSIGAQSFVGSELRFLERIHSPREIINAFEFSHNAGFDNIGIDLIFAIPGQTEETLAYTIKETIKLQPEHISAYSLIYEPGTELYRDYISDKIKAKSEDEAADLYHYIIQTLDEAGYKQYEVSNYALADKYKCRHNLNYWQRGEYYAFGPSAHGYTAGERYWNFRNLAKYYELLDNDLLPVEGKEKLTARDRLNEYILLGLRAEGIDLRTLSVEFDVDLIARAGDFISELIGTGFMIKKGTKLKMTAKGYSLCDEIILKIIEKI